MAIHTPHGYVISDKNKKMGDIWSFSVPPVATCPKDAPCALNKACYVVKYLRRRKNILETYQENKRRIDEIIRLYDSGEDHWLEGHKRYDELVTDISAQIRVNDVRYFRWNVSGDIYHEYYLEAMIDIALRCPDCKFWVFTKQYDVLNNYLAKRNAYELWKKYPHYLGYIFPSNLNIIISIWGDFRPSKDTHLEEMFPTCMVRLKKGDSGIPEDVYQCPGACRQCLKCLYAERNEIIVIDEHN